MAAEKEAALRSESASALEQGEISGEPSFRIWHYSCGRVSDEIYVYKACPRCGGKHSLTKDVTDLIRGDRESRALRSPARRGHQASGRGHVGTVLAARRFGP